MCEIKKKKAVGANLVDSWVLHAPTWKAPLTCDCYNLSLWHVPHICTVAFTFPLLLILLSYKLLFSRSFVMGAHVHPLFTGTFILAAKSHIFKVERFHPRVWPQDNFRLSILFRSFPLEYIHMIYLLHVFLADTLNTTVWANYPKWGLNLSSWEGNLHQSVQLV